MQILYFITLCHIIGITWQLFSLSPSGCESLRWGVSHTGSSPLTLSPVLCIHWCEIQGDEVLWDGVYPFLPLPSPTPTSMHFCLEDPSHHWTCPCHISGCILSVMHAIPVTWQMSSFLCNYCCCRFRVLNVCSVGALLKAALICAKVVDFPSDISLKVQLKNKYGSGFEMETWSNLPHGSGLNSLCSVMCDFYIYFINVICLSYWNLYVIT